MQSYPCVKTRCNKTSGATAAWATRRDGSVRTTGLALISADLPPGSLELAELIGRRFRSDFAVTPAASGKICIIGVESKSASLFQIKDGFAEAVHCGNAVCATAAAIFMFTGKKTCSLRIKHPTKPIQVNATVMTTGEGFSAQTVWNLESNSIGVQGAVSSAKTWARVDGINSYTIIIVDSLPTVLPQTRCCGDKICFVERNGAIPRIRVASCGRWHGALPQTGAIALAIARRALPFIADAIPTGVVSHAGGDEALPNCIWKRSFIHVEIPETEILFAAPELIP